MANTYRRESSLIINFFFTHSSFAFSETIALLTMSAKRKSAPNKISSLSPQIDDIIPEKQIKIDQQQYLQEKNNNNFKDKTFISSAESDNDEDEEEAEPETYGSNGADVAAVDSKVAPNQDHISTNADNHKNNNYPVASMSEISTTDEEYESESSGHSSKSTEKCQNSTTGLNYYKDKVRKLKLNKRSMDDVLMRLSKNSHFQQK